MKMDESTRIIQKIIKKHIEQYEFLLLCVVEPLNFAPALAPASPNAGISILTFFQIKMF